MIPLTIDFTKNGGGPQVAIISGRLNAASAPEAKERVKAIVNESSGLLVVDLSGLDFIDSSGLTVLVSAYKAAAEAGGSLKLSAPSPQVSQVLALTHLDRVFEIYPSREAAAEAFR
jgi:anti-sigma B factor antagonist